MELCTCRAVRNLPKPCGFAPCQMSHNRLPWIKTASNFGFAPGFSAFLRRLQYGATGKSSITLAKPEETSSFTSQYMKDEPDRVLTTEDSKSGEQISAYEALQKQEEQYDNAMKNEESEENPFSEFRAKFSEFFDQIDIEFDPENISSLLVYGGGSGVVLWLTSAVIGAIDSIPLFPKLMEVVGLGYTVWFTSRYLLLKKNRAELASKVEEIKKQVLGSDGD